MNRKRLVPIALSVAIVSTVVVAIGSIQLHRSKGRFSFLDSYNPIKEPAQLGFALTKPEIQKVQQSGRVKATLYLFRSSADPIEQRVQHELSPASGWELHDHDTINETYLDSQTGEMLLFSRGDPRLFESRPTPSGVTCYVVAVEKLK